MARERMLEIAFVVGADVRRLTVPNPKSEIRNRSEPPHVGSYKKRTLFGIGGLYTGKGVAGRKCVRVAGVLSDKALQLDGGSS